MRMPAEFTIAVHIRYKDLHSLKSWRGKAVALVARALRVPLVYALGPAQGEVVQEAA